MGLVYTRRRLLAFAAVLLARPAAAQQTFAQPPAQQSSGVVIRDIGTWHVVTQALNGRAWLLPAGISVSGKAVQNGNFVDGGNAELQLEYWGGDGINAGLTATLTINVAGVLNTHKPARLVVDGKEVGKYDVDHQLKLDLIKALPVALPQVKLIQVYMPVGQEEALVYEAKPAGTDEVLPAIRQGPDAFFRSQPRPSPGQGQPQPCYITTACCGVIGLRDDCFELRSLRRFRDRVMAATAEGRADIAHYYATAPRIVAAIERQGEERRLLAEYLRCILPASVMARLGLVALPWRMYRAMMRRLTVRYAG